MLQQKRTVGVVEENKRNVSSIETSETDKEETQKKKSKGSKQQTTTASDGEYLLNTQELVNHFDEMKSKFVNRAEISIELAKALISQKETEKGFLPILSQQYGSGKTALVSKFRSVLKKNNTVPFPSSESSIYLMKAVLVRIDVSTYFNQTNFDSFIQTLDNMFVSKLMNLINLMLENVDRSALGQDYITKLENSIAISKSLKEDINCDPKFKKARNFTDILYLWAEENLFPLLLFFDEVTMLNQEQITLLWHQLNCLMGCDIGENVSRARAKGIYIVFAGKSAILTKLGRAIEVSPTPACHLILKMFTVENIIQLVDSLVISKTHIITMKQVLKNQMAIGDNYEYFCKVLHDYSGGIPRLVVASVYSLAKYCAEGGVLDLSERTTIDSLFRNFKCGTPLAQIRNLQEIANFAESSHPSFSAFQKFYYFACIGLPVVMDSKTIELVYGLNIGIDTSTDSDSIIRLIVPKYITISNTLPTTVLVLKSVFSYGLSEIVDKGMSLEVSLRDILITRIILRMITNKSNNNTWSDIHTCFSKSTILKDKKIEIDSPCVRYMPKIVSDNTNSRSAPDYLKMLDSPWEHQVIDTDWPKIKSIFIQGKCIIHPAPKSRSSDFYFHLPPTEIVAFSIKNYPLTIFNLQMLQEEIDKCSLCMQQKSFTKIALFVFCNGIDKSYLDRFCTDDGCLVIGSGIHEFCEGSSTPILIDSLFNPTFKKLIETPKSIQSYSTNHNNIQVYVPDGMEVIILKQTNLESFFTKADMQMIQQLSLSNENPIDYIEYVNELLTNNITI